MTKARTIVFLISAAIRFNNIKEKEQQSIIQQEIYFGSANKFINLYYC